MTKRAVQQLSRLLEEERAALIEGDFETVGALIEEKESLVTQFEAVEVADLKLLAVALAHNSKLFAAAREGVATVVTTLAKQKEARTTLSSYDAAGKATQISRSTSGTERRY